MIYDCSFTLVVLSFMFFMYILTNCNNLHGSCFPGVNMLFYLCITTVHHYYYVSIVVCTMTSSISTWVDLWNTK